MAQPRVPPGRTAAERRVLLIPAPPNAAICDAGSMMPSRSQIRRAGERLRRNEPPSEADRQIYSGYRDTFAEPLREVAETIGSFADGAPVQSRLKRFETVVEKLRRRTNDLSRLEDIAGCRVILPTMVEQHQTRNRIRESWDIVRERDYQTTPRDGYRALHIVVRAKTGQSRCRCALRWKTCGPMHRKHSPAGLARKSSTAAARLRRARCWMMHPCFARDWTLPQHVALSLTALMAQTRQTLEVR